MVCRCCRRASATVVATSKPGPGGRWGRAWSPRPPELPALPLLYAQVSPGPTGWKAWSLTPRILPAPARGDVAWWPAGARLPTDTTVAAGHACGIFPSLRPLVVDLTVA